jgi:hypothetical protein
MHLLRPLLVCCVLAGVQAGELQAQDRTKVVLYRDRLAAQFDTVDCVKNLFKVNPLLFMRGEVPLYYERALTPRLSDELGLGFTLRNYLGGSLSGDDVDAFSAGTKIVPRPSYHIAARFYLSDDIEPQGWYAQVEFAHLEYIKDITTKDATGSFTDVVLRDERIFNDLRLLLGYQMLASSSNWAIDAYGGLGLRNRSMMKVKEELDLTNDQYTYTVDKVNDSVIAVFLGFRVGYGF